MKADQLLSLLHPHRRLPRRPLPPPPPDAPLPVEVENAEVKLELNDEEKAEAEKPEAPELVKLEPE